MYSNVKNKNKLINCTKFEIKPMPCVEIDLNSLEKEFIQNEEETKENYNPFKLTNLQTYNPIYEKILDTHITEETQNKYIPDVKYHFLDMKTVIDNENTQYEKPIFIKYSPLLNACKYMIGFYDMNNELIRELPKIKKNNFNKIDSIYNFSYVDGFFCYLCSKLLHNHNCINMLDYYGSYLCIQDKFKINITDDFSNISSYTQFFKNNDTYFTFSYSSELTNNNGTNKNKTALNIEDDAVEELEIEFDEINIDVIENNKNSANLGNLHAHKMHNKSETIDDTDECIDNEIVVDDISEHIINREDTNNNIKNNEETNDVNNSDISTEEEDNTYDDDGDEDDDTENWETDDEEDEGEGDEDSEEDSSSEQETSDSSYSDDENKIYAYINNFPVQMICLEKCENTVDSLFMDEEITEEIGLSFMMQITFTLLCLQKAFHFTHNDLHTNNIMYNKTDLEFIYYKYNSIIYKVPTYGYLFKIIDFGRGVYKFNGIVYCSDSYSKHEDAYTQYNFEPFYNSKFPKIEPNYSFDLCRLGISIYDIIMEPVEKYEELDEFQKWIYRICQDDKNKSIIYKKNGETRYSGFKMYQMIAKTVHNHTPASQLNLPVVKQFIIKEKEFLENSKSEKYHLFNIDELPSYV